MIHNSMTPQLIALADWDNTLSEGFVIERWVEHLSGANLFDATDDVRDLFSSFRRGELAYEDFCRNVAFAYARGLRGKSRDQVRNEAARFTITERSKIYGFARPLLAELMAAGVRMLVITGAPSEPMLYVCAGIDAILTGSLTIGVNEVGIYSGTVMQNPGISSEKARLVDSAVQSRIVVAGFGDSVSDRPLLEAAKLRFLVISERAPPWSLGHELIHLDVNAPVHQIVASVMTAIRERSPWLRE